MAVQTTYSDSPEVGLAGQIYDGHQHEAITMRNNEAADEMPFGAAVIFEGGTDDKGALLPDDVADVVAGLVIRSHAYSPDTGIGDVGVKPGQTIGVMRRGFMLAICEDGCSPGDRLHVRAIQTVDEQIGGLRASADGVNTIDATNQGVWLTTAAAGGLAVLQVDFLNKP